MVEDLIALNLVAVVRALSDLGLVEIALLAAVLLLGPSRLARNASLQRFDRLLATWSRHRFALPAGMGIGLVAVRLLLLPIIAAPTPFIADEFSHLLLGRTLALGRFANPAHPLWQHFETIHVLQQPHYVSMYMPGQGLFLALGVLLGHPWFGVLITAGLMAAATMWMLQGWVPARWAAVGGLIVVLRYGLFSYWTNGYWGGHAAALGGALVLGTAGRAALAKPVHGWVLGAGLALMAVTRPLEGAVFALAALTALAWQSWRRGSLWRLLRAWAPGVVVLLAATAAFLLTYTHATTGNALKPGYLLNQEVYGWPMTLPGYQPPQVAFRHDELQKYFDWERNELTKKTTLLGWARFGLDYAQLLWRFFVGPALSIPLWFALRSAGSRRWMIPVCGGTAALAVVVFEMGYPHYLSPATGCIVLMLVHGLRVLRAWRRRSRAGVGLARACAAILVVCAAVRIVAEPFDAVARQHRNMMSWCCNPRPGDARDHIDRSLRQVPGRDVVIVRYDRDGHMDRNWVHNEADIDSSEVIWATDMGPVRNLELLRYYPARQFWIVDADHRPELLRVWPDVRNGAEKLGIRLASRPMDPLKPYIPEPEPQPALRIPAEPNGSH